MQFFMERSTQKLTVKQWHNIVPFFATFIDYFIDLCNNSDHTFMLEMLKSKAEALGFLFLMRDKSYARERQSHTKGSKNTLK